MVFVLISSNFPSCGVLSSASISAWVKNFGKRRASLGGRKPSVGFCLMRRSAAWKSKNDLMASSFR